MTLGKIVKTCLVFGTMAWITAFMAFGEGWDDSSGSWRWINEDGSVAKECWKSANGYWFYLDDKGLIARNQLIIESSENDTNYYYVDANGKLVRDKWKAVAIDPAEKKDRQAQYWWYYFGNDGKAYKLKGSTLTTDDIRTIDGKKYAFDRKGRMLYGWIESSNVKHQDYNDSAWRYSDYYFGDWDNGHARPGWIQMRVYVPHDECYKDYWFYFDSNGKKAKSQKKVIDGVNYYFESDGHMAKSWT